MSEKLLLLKQNNWINLIGRIFQNLTPAFVENLQKQEFFLMISVLWQPCPLGCLFGGTKKNLIYNEERNSFFIYICIFYITPVY